MDKKKDLIYDILHSINFNFVKTWANVLKVNGIIETNSCNTEKWNDLLSIYGIKKYDVVKKALEQAYEDQNNYAYLYSLKAEIYDIGKNRNPSKKHIRALLQIIFEKQAFQIGSTLKSAHYIQKVFTLTQDLQKITGEENIILYSEPDINSILQKLDIKTLQILYEKFASDKWTNIDNSYSDDDYLTNYLENMNLTNMSFLYHNVDYLYKYYNKIDFILKKLAYANPEKLQIEYENLKKKRIYSISGDCYNSLNTLKYEIPVEPITKEMVHKIEQYALNFPNLQSLIFSIGKLTPLKWNFLLLLIRNYEEHPTGKKVCTWLEKVQYD